MAPSSTVSMSVLKSTPSPRTMTARTAEANETSIVVELLILPLASFRDTERAPREEQGGLFSPLSNRGVTWPAAADIERHLSVSAGLAAISAGVHGTSGGLQQWFQSKSSSAALRKTWQSLA
eukprot:scaffold68042_cov46-Prasinocladus_malaysianus.AAC.2